jgi:hypothetical protein
MTNDTTPSIEPHRLKAEYFALGVQYYVAGRSAAFAHLNPVAANILHHAVEMCLKGALVSQILAGKKYKHRLVDLWAAFKAQATDQHELVRLDTSVIGLHRYERLRYPEDFMREGMSSMLHLESAPVELPEPVPAPIAKDPPRYDLVLRDIDELIAVIFAQANVNPVFFTGGLNPAARACLLNEPRARIIPPAS